MSLSKVTLNRLRFVRSFLAALSDRSFDVVPSFPQMHDQTPWNLLFHEKWAVVTRFFCVLVL